VVLERKILMSLQQFNALSIPSWSSVVTTMGNCLCSWDGVEVGGRRFIVRERIGEGGFSTVDLIQDRTTRKYFVVKRISCHGKEDEANALKEVEFHERFNVIDCENVIKMECTSIKKLRSREKSSLSSVVLIVLPYYRRGTLQSELDHRRSKSSFIDEGRVLRLFLGVCRAIAHLHSPPPAPASSSPSSSSPSPSSKAGAATANPTDSAVIDFETAFPSAIAHRDLKPANILLTDDDVPILMDFGSCDLARWNVNDSKAAMALQDIAGERCTMPYRAPELFNVSSQCQIDERTDIWSLGCLLFAICFLRGPFDEAYEKGDSLALAANSGNIPFPASHPFSAGVTDLIRRMMNVEPQQRPYIGQVLSTVKMLQSERQNRV